MNIDVAEILEQLAPDVTPETCFVSVYTTERRYGGPEEGGWWYNWRVFGGAKRCSTRTEAEQVAERLQTWAEQQNTENEPERWKRCERLPDEESPYADCTEGYIPIGWGDGGALEIAIESRAGGYESTERPRYE